MAKAGDENRQNFCLVRASGTPFRSSSESHRSIDTFIRFAFFTSVEKRVQSPDYTNESGWLVEITAADLNFTAVLKSWNVEARGTQFKL